MNWCYVYRYGGSAKRYGVEVLNWLVFQVIAVKYTLIDEYY